MKVSVLVLPIFLLSACGGITKQEFLEDQQNQKKYEEQTETVKENECDKLKSLVEFTHIESPTPTDLAKILPLIGLKSTDATNDVSKLYTSVDYSMIGKYSCNYDWVIELQKRYCIDKYYNESKLETVIYFPYRLIAGIIGMVLLSSDVDVEPECIWHPSSCHKKAACEKYLTENIPFTKYDRDALVVNIQKKIHEIYPIPPAAEILLPVFSVNELIKENRVVLGTYDNYAGECHGYLCDSATNNVTRTNAAIVIYEFCDMKMLEDNKLYKYYRFDICRCYAHETYKKVDYKNLIYIREKHEVPQSKKKEFDQAFSKCTQRVDQDLINENVKRYGEATIK